MARGGADVFAVRRHHGDVHLLLAQARCDFQPDKAAPQDDGTGAVTHVGEDRPGVLLRAQEMHARQANARDVKRPRDAARRDQGGIEVVASPIAQRRPALCDVQPLQLGLDALDPLPGIERRRAKQRDIARAHLAGKDEFAERRAVERKTGLPTDQQDSSAKPEFAQGRSGGGACRARPGDQQDTVVLGCRRRCCNDWFR